MSYRSSSMFHLPDTPNLHMVVDLNNMISYTYLRTRPQYIVHLDRILHQIPYHTTIHPLLQEELHMNIHIHINLLVDHRCRFLPLKDTSMYHQGYNTIRHHPYLHHHPHMNRCDQPPVADLVCMMYLAWHHLDIP